MPLHPDLAEIHDQFNNILDSYEEGKLTYEDATSSVANLGVVDGKGFKWGINEDGDFIKAIPGNTPQVADPNTFASPQQPGQFDQPQSRSPGIVAPPWSGVDDTDLSQPPSFTRNPTPLSPWSSETNHDETYPDLAYRDEEEENIFAQEYGNDGPVKKSRLKVNLPKKTGGVKEQKVKTIHETRPSRNISAPTFDTDRIIAFIQRNKITIGVAAACLVILIIVISSHKSSSNSGSVPRAGTNTTALPLSSMPTSGSLPALPALPTNDTEQNLGRAITSCNLTTAKAAVASLPSSQQTALLTGQLCGYAKVNLSLAYGPPASSGKGAVAIWTLLSGNTPIASAKVQFTKSATAWLLTSFPQFTAAK